MAKIKFNNKEFQIDDATLAPAKTELKSHLSTVMAGTGATITIDGTSYNVDATKLAAAKDDFVAHLGTIAGDGAKITVGNTEYSIDSTKIAGAISELESALSGTGEERLEGDGAEYYTLAPTALSFRSTAPLNELQEVQINGVTVDPANYTLEEGSTIVTFPIDYLKTLNVGSYEVAVASESKTVKGDFTVAAPELNEHGFYYNQPYSAEVPSWGKVVFFIREDGTYDLINGYGTTTTNTYTVNGNSIVALDATFGAFHCTVSSDGKEIYCAEVQTALKLSNDASFAADDDYLYVYKEDLGGYEVKCVDKTKAEYGAIKTGINGIDTVKLAKFCFQNCANLVNLEIAEFITIIGEWAFSDCSALKSIKLPASVTTIGEYAFCSSTYDEPYSLENITFEGTVEQWNAIVKGDLWNANISATHVHCIDGDVAL
jgi:hypothetical protein